MLYHSDSLSDAKKFVAIEGQLCREYATRKFQGEADPQLNTEQSQLMEQFTLIGRQLNMVLDHMRNRLDGQKTFIHCITDTIELAQSLLDKAIADRKARLEKQRIEREERER